MGEGELTHGYQPNGSPGEDRGIVFFLDVGVESGRHGGIRSLALTVD